MIDRLLVPSPTSSAAMQREGPVVWMTAQDVMRSIVPVYPPEHSNVLRAGALWGEPSPQLEAPTDKRAVRCFLWAGRWGAGFLPVSRRRPAFWRPERVDASAARVH